MKVKIKINSLLFIFILIAVIGIGTTFALFYSSSFAANKFKIMNYNVVLTDNFDDNWGKREVFISNNDSNSDVVIRVSYNELFSKSFDDNILILSNTIDGEDVVYKGWTDDFLNNFTLGDDGWYYYKKILRKSESVRLMESFMLNKDLLSKSYDSDNYLRYNYELDFNYEAISADSDSIKDIWNKTVTIEGDNVIW